jgi:phage gp36-like protein
MAYCTQADLVSRFGENELIGFTDMAGLGVIDTTVLNPVIDDATARIDSYLRSKYSLPLLTVPAELITAACDIVRYLLHRDLVTDIAKDRYNQAISFLKDLSRGRAVLDVSVNDAIAVTARLSVPKITAPQAFFTDELLGKM